MKSKSSQQPAWQLLKEDNRRPGKNASTAKRQQIKGEVFFPAAGNMNNTSLNNAGSNGNYWSSSLNTSNTNNAYNLNFNSSNVNPQNNNNRYNGFTVRPVQHLLTIIYSKQTIESAT